MLRQWITGIKEGGYSEVACPHMGTLPVNRQACFGVGLDLVRGSAQLLHPVLQGGTFHP